MRKFLSATIGLVILSSCVFFVGHKIYGISRYVRISELDSPDCIVQSIEAIPYITILKKKIVKSSDDPSIIYSDLYKRYDFLYSIDSVDAYLQVYVYKTHNELKQSLLSINPIPQREIETIRPVMIQIEKNFKTICGDDVFQSEVKESCENIICKK